MTVGEIREITWPSCRALIERDGKIVYIDWFYKIPEELRREKIKELIISTEVRHKNWKKLGLDRPLQPDELPDYSFSDLEMKIYYRMLI